METPLAEPFAADDGRPELKACANGAMISGKYLMKSCNSSGARPVKNEAAPLAELVLCLVMSSKDPCSSRGTISGASIASSLRFEEELDALEAAEANDWKAEMKSLMTTGASLMNSWNNS